MVKFDIYINRILGFHPEFVFSSGMVNFDNVDFPNKNVLKSIQLSVDQKKISLISDGEFVFCKGLGEKFVEESQIQHNVCW